MKVYSNVSKTDPKKKQDTSSSNKTIQAKPVGGGDSNVSLTFKRGSTSKSYTPESAETGHKAYGAVGSGEKVKGLLDKARAAKQDIAYDKDNKPYRAGRTVETKEKDNVDTRINVKDPIKPVKLSGGTPNKTIPPKTPSVGKKPQAGQTVYKLKRMNSTSAGEDRGGHPHTFYAGGGASRKLKNRGVNRGR